MFNSWGNSWGRSWGSSWGLVYSINVYIEGILITEKLEYNRLVIINYNPNIIEYNIFYHYLEYINNDKFIVEPEPEPELAGSTQSGSDVLDENIKVYIRYSNT